MELHAVIWKEEDRYVIKETIAGVTTQGKTIQEAIENLKEAVSLYLEEMPEVIEEIKAMKLVGTITVEITRFSGK